MEGFQPTSADLALLASPVVASPPAHPSPMLASPPTPCLSPLPPAYPSPPGPHHSNSLSSIFSLTQKAATPTITSNSFFKRSLSNTSWTYSARETDM